MIAAIPASSRMFIERIPLADGWEMAVSSVPTGPDQLQGLHFMPAQVPGTAASALQSQGLWRRGEGPSLDASEYWFRCRFDAEAADRGEQVMLQIGGIATIAEVWLNGGLILTSSSMFASHEVDVSELLKEHNELLIACRPLLPALQRRRGQPPHNRWRTRVVGEQQLRWFRTSLLGRAPGFAPEPAPVGPWRPISLIRRRDIAVEDFSRRVECDGSTGIVRAEVRVRPLRDGATPAAGWLQSDQLSTPIEWKRSGDLFVGRALLRIPDVRRWWPHIHGEPALYPLRLEIELAGGESFSIDDLAVGFRTVDSGAGFGLRVNGVPVFCRGVVWTPPDPIGLNASEDALRERLQTLRDGGFNLIRVPGTGAYECDAFHRLCDEMGLLVWQDMMFANMDYPFPAAAFSETVHNEVRLELSRLSRHASTAVLCGNSEIEQQVGMLGLDPKLGRGSFFGEELPEIAAEVCPGIPYLPSAPCGGDLAFRAREGVANYFGVGAYLRPLEDVRRAGVRFASECLAFSNVPEPETIEKMSLAVPGGITPVHPAWKRAVPRDGGAGWDFEDVRDHYLKLLYGVDPAALRYSDPGRYWELSRMVSGEVMAEVFGEWRREKSGCAGGIVLWSADLEPGAGWGILDSSGRPKGAYWFLKRALAPVSVWSTDEGLNGVDVHAANDRSVPLEASIRVAVYARGEYKVAEAARRIAIGAHASVTIGVEEILGRFLDASYSYRFGPPAHDLICASLETESGEPFAQCFRFTAARPLGRQAPSDLGLAVQAKARTDGRIDVVLSARRFVWGARVSAPGSIPDDCYFSVEPGGGRHIVMTPTRLDASPAAIAVAAVNAEGRLSVAVEKAA
jgi:beta-mannosidase